MARPDVTALFRRIWRPPRPGETFVLLHGLGMSSRYMKQLAATLAKQALVYAPDLPGHGRSPRPPEAFDIPQLAASVRAWLDQEQIASAVFVGHSMGAQVVVELAALAPERVKAAVLLSPTMDQTRRTPYAHIWRLLADPWREPASLMALAAMDYLSEGPVRAWQEFRHAVRHDMLGRIAHLRAPTLIVRGECDPIVSAEFVEQLARRLPKGSLRNVEGAAHALHYSAPRETARLIEKFLAATAREARAFARSADHPPSHGTADRRTECPPEPQH